ncbi:MAG TPA: LysE family transporter [Thermoleophilia bacterium]|nr:LysE family transporter [Thermoleophilia bacterium]
MELVLMFFSSMLIAYSGAIMPGPMLAVVVAESPRQGVRAGPLVVLGHALLELALLGLLVLGLGPLLVREGVQAVLSMVGGVMLVATAAAMLLSVVRDTARLEYGAAGGRAHGRAVLGGVVSSLSNPYWSIWWATIGLSLLTKAYALGAAALVAFYVGHILGDLTWYSAVSGVIAAGRRWITPRRYRVMVAVMACFLLVLAAWFVVSGVRLAN